MCKHTNKEKVILQIEDVRVTRSDPHNLKLERLETKYNPKTKKETNSFQFKGYYSTILGALKAIQYKELLIDENNVNDLEGILKGIERSNEKISKKIDEVTINE